jgi:hypothetical protein
MAAGCTTCSGCVPIRSHLTVGIVHIGEKDLSVTVNLKPWSWGPLGRSQGQEPPAVPHRKGPGN